MSMHTQKKPPCITREQALAHIKSGANTCPACGADDPCYGSVDMNGTETGQKVSCDSCGARWYESYKLFSLYDANHENTFSVHDGEPTPEAVGEVVAAAGQALEAMELISASSLSKGHSEYLRDYEGPLREALAKLKEAQA